MPELPWNPDTKTPESPTSAIIALSITDGELKGEYYMVEGAIYTYNQGDWWNELTGKSLSNSIGESPFFWLSEADLMATIKAD